MKTIPLTKGYDAIVDDEDYEYLMQWKWHVNVHPRANYAVRKIRISPGRQRAVRMHRDILGLERGDKIEVDHINHNGLDNRRENLRPCTGSQNQGNQRIRTNASGFKGVSGDRKMWRAQISKEGSFKHLGNFKHPEDAARAYDDAARKQFGEFALVNFPDVK